MLITESNLPIWDGTGKHPPFPFQGYLRAVEGWRGVSHVEVRAETSRSWDVGAVYANRTWMPARKKWSKKEFHFISPEAARQQLWCFAARDRIARIVARIDDPSVLRKVADAIGYKDDQEKP